MDSTCILAFGIVAVTSVLGAQSSVDEARKRMTERQNTGNPNSFVTPESRTPQITYTTYLSKERVWTDQQGRTMNGRLVAFSAPEPGKSGEIIVIVSGKVRLRRSGATQNSDLPLQTLSGPDQQFVQQIAEAVKPRPSEETAAPAKPD